MTHYWKQRVSSSLSEREALNVKYERVRWTLLALVIMTVLNGFIVFACGICMYLKMSAIIPYYLILRGMGITGKLPEELFERNYLTSIPYDSFYFITFLVVALFIVGLYILFWYLSKNGKGVWLLLATVLYAVDTVSLLFLKEITVYVLLDITLHAVFLSELIGGVVTYRRLKALPSKSLHNESEESFQRVSGSLVESTPLRYVENGEKARTFIEAPYEGHKVVLRRRRLRTELVVDGRVYDEYVGLVEYAYTLKATCGGCRFVAEFDGKENMLLKADGKILGRKTRFI